MSVLIDKLAEAAVEVLWRQWRAIGGAASGSPVSKQVDPEMLCLGSLAFADEEPRLAVVLEDWLRLGARHLSTQRARNLATNIPDGERLASRLARTALAAAGDSRWKSLLSRGAIASREEPLRRRSGGPDLLAPPALTLRFRNAFSVGLKADLLAFLIGQRIRVSVSTAADSLGYSVPTVFRGLQDLRASGLVQVTEQTAAAEYWLDAPSWHPVLGMPYAYWGFWREVFGYVLAVVAWSRKTNNRVSAYAQGTSLRTAAQAHAAALVRAAGMDEQVPQPETPTLTEWKDYHRRLATWMVERA